MNLLIITDAIPNSNSERVYDGLLILIICSILFLPPLRMYFEHQKRQSVYQNYLRAAMSSSSLSEPVIQQDNGQVQDNTNIISSTELEMDQCLDYHHSKIPEAFEIDPEANEKRKVEVSDWLYWSIST